MYHHQALSSWKSIGSRCLLVFGTVAVLSLVATRLLDRCEWEAAEQDLRVKASLLGRLASVYQRLPSARMQADARELTADIDSRVTFLDARGNALADSAVDPALIANLAEQPEIRAALAGETRAVVRHSDALGETMVFAAHKVGGEDSPVAIVRVSDSVERIRAGSRRLEFTLWTGAAGTAFGMVFVSLFLSAPSAPSLGGAPRAGSVSDALALFIAFTQRMRASLATIKACGETLLLGAVDDFEQRGGFLKQIDAEADYLHYLLADGVTWAELQAGKRDGPPESVAAAPVIAECVAHHQERAHGQQVTLSAVGANELESSSALFVWANEDVFRQMLDHLVTRALECTPRGGGIRIHADRVANHVRVRLALSCPVLNAREAERLFEPFFRVENLDRPGRTTSGLGFAIAAQLANSQGGSVWAEATPERGVTITIKLPAARPTMVRASCAG